MQMPLFALFCITFFCSLNLHLLPPPLCAGGPVAQRGISIPLRHTPLCRAKGPSSATQRCCHAGRKDLPRVVLCHRVYPDPAIH